MSPLCLTNVEVEIVLEHQNDRTLKVLPYTGLVNLLTYSIRSYNTNYSGGC